jgi:hypothetical protein
LQQSSLLPVFALGNPERNHRCLRRVGDVMICTMPAAAPALAKVTLRKHYIFATRR